VADCWENCDESYGFMNRGEFLDQLMKCSPLKSDDVPYNFLFAVALRPNAGHGLLILEVSRSHKNNALQSVGLLWTSDQLVAETSTCQHTTLTTDKHPCPPVGFEPTISAGERPQTHALDRAATGTGAPLVNYLPSKRCTHTDYCIEKIDQKWRLAPKAVQ